MRLTRGMGSPGEFVQVLGEIRVLRWEWEKGRERHWDQDPEMGAGGGGGKKSRREWEEAINAEEKEGEV